MDLGQWMTMGLFQSSSSINLLENGDAFVASQISQHSDYFDPEIMHAAEEGMGLTLKLGIKLRTDPETVSQYAHTEMMNLLALLQSDSSKLQHTFTRGGSWGVLVKLNPTGFVTTTENGENDACVITSTNFMHQLKDFAKIFLPATVMCVLAFKMD